MDSWIFACPSCHNVLEPVSSEERRCPHDGRLYRREGRIWRFLLPDRMDYFRQFIKEYETVRRAEGRSSADPSYYRALPFEDLTGRQAENWRIRAKTFETLAEQVLPDWEAGRGEAEVLDLGAGNGWLSYQLRRRGHRVAAVDLLTNDFDGLGCFVHYDAAFTPIQAEFERLPFPNGSVDLAIFNASAHYATDYARVLLEALRVLRPEGRVVILDSPVYRNEDSGRRMVREREIQFQREYGFPSNAISSENYLTYRRLDALANELQLRWQLIRPFYGWGWALRPWRARLRRRREPAQFMLIVGRRGQ